MGFFIVIFEARDSDSKNIGLSLGQRPPFGDLRMKVGNDFSDFAMEIDGRHDD
jgi:hypothetical protein